MSPNNSQAQHVVTAVLVAHDGAAWIPRVTAALLNQTRPVQRVVGVDTGSRDRSGAMLAEAFGRGAVFGMDRGTGYAAAVTQALRHRAANTHLPPAPGGPAERTEWIWLLHDDSEPEPDALEQLLLAAEHVSGAAVLGPKVMDWADRDVLLEVGVGIDRASRRITGLEPREVDQGQHDGDRDVLAVGSAGMLVRRDVWDQVGGFDQGMLLYREDVDFCWRVQAAGYRVRVISDAVIYHMEASARNRRPASAAPRRGRQDRRNALLVLVGNLPARPMLVALIGNLVLSTLRTVFFLVAKRPGAALDEFVAYTEVAAHPARLLAVRRYRARGRRAAYSRLRAEVPPGRSFRRLAEFAFGVLSRSLPVDMVGSHHATEDPSDDDSLLVDTGLVQRLLSNPGVLLFLGLTTITLVAARSLLSGSPLGGGALVPAWGGASDLWSEYLQGFHPVGVGTSASTPPYVAVIASLASLLGGKPWLAVDVILIGCVPLAGVTAYLASRRVTRFVPARVWASASYALLPVGMGAVATGRLGTALLLVLMPVIAARVARVFTPGRRRARRAAWAAALLIGVVSAFVPFVLVITLAGMVLGAFAFGRGRQAVLINAAIVAVVPILLLLPWSLSLAIHPSQLLLEAGLHPSGLARPVPTARSLLLLSPGGPGLPPYLVTTGLCLAAVVALLAGARRTPVLAGWSAAVLGLLAAAGLSRAVVTPAAGGAPVPAWPGPALAFAGAGLLLAVLATGDALSGKLGSGRWRGPNGLVVVVLAVVACTAPVLAAAAWVTTGVRGPVAPVAGPVLPAFVSVSSANGTRLRTLVLRADAHDKVAYSVIRATDPPIGTNELATPIAAQRALNLSVAALTAPGGGAVQDQGRSLAQFGIGYVLMPRPVSAGLSRLLDGVPGLRPVSKTPAFELWRVSDTTSRLRVAESGGTVVPVRSGTVDAAGVRAPAAGGTLVLAEPAGGWSATLNGHPLTPLAAPVDGWAQGFHLPSGGGSLSVSRSQSGRLAAVALEALAVAVVAALGLPGARVAGEDREEAAVVARRGNAGDKAGDRVSDKVRGGTRGRSRDRKPGRRGKGRVESPPRPARWQPVGPAAADARMSDATPAGVRGGAPARPGAPSGPLPGPLGRGGRGPDSPGLPRRSRADDGRHGQSRPYPPAGGRGYPNDGSGPLRRAPDSDPRRPRLDRRVPPDRSGRPAPEPSNPDRGRPLPDRGPTRGSRPGHEPVPTDRAGSPVDQGVGWGAGGRVDYGVGPRGVGGADYDPGRGQGRGGEVDYGAGPRRGGGAGSDSVPGRGRQSDGGAPPGRNGWRSRVGWPGRGRGTAHAPSPQPGESPGPGVPRGRLAAGGSQSLPPLPPPPPRRRGAPGRFAADEAGRPDWDSGPRNDSGEPDW